MGKKHQNHQNMAEFHVKMVPGGLQVQEMRFGDVFWANFGGISTLSTLYFQRGSESC